MTERGILFSTPMVRAILAGTKTQTRRIVRAPKCATVHGRVSYPELSHADGGAFTPKGEQCLHWAYGGGDHGKDVLKARVFCPHGTLGDRLWVRETFSACRHGAKHRECIDYRADGERDDLTWKPSIFMPRALSRITLEIQEIRVERVASITEDDARREGVPPAWLDVNGKDVNANAPPTFRQGFARLWNDINGKRGSWATNPYVWCISFEVVKPKRRTHAPGLHPSTLLR